MKRIIRNTLFKCGYELYRHQPRKSTILLKNKYGNKKLKGCEIGVFKGDNAKVLLKYLNIRKLYLVDPYENYEGYDDVDELCLEFDLKYIAYLAKQRLSKYPVKFVYKKTEDSYPQVPNKLDFVYIDGNHRYDYVMKDLTFAHKKVKKGGMILGHDIQNEEVLKALQDFCDKNKLKFYINLHEWYIYV